LSDVRATEQFGDQGSAEVDLVTHQDVGFPLAHDVGQDRGMPAGTDAREAVPHDRFLACQIHGFQRSHAAWPRRPAFAGRERRESRRLDGLDHRAVACECDDEACGLGSTCQWDEGMEVAGTTDEREQDAHSSNLPAAG
jgi:hypothetical protein